MIFKLFAAYVAPTFALLNQNPFMDSVPISTVACGHPVRSVEREHKNIDTWSYVSIGNYTGYIEKKLLIEKVPSCIQDEYPRFFLEMNFDLTDSFYLAKLQSRYIGN